MKRLGGPMQAEEALMNKELLLQIAEKKRNKASSPESKITGGSSNE
jgi:hypothetical protein